MEKILLLISFIIKLIFSGEHCETTVSGMAYVEIYVKETSNLPDILYVMSGDNNSVICTV